MVYNERTSIPKYPSNNINRELTSFKKNMEHFHSQFLESAK